MVGRLSERVELSGDDLELLNLRHLHGMPMRAVAERLGLQGDPYKRYHRVIRKLRVACVDVGITCRVGDPARVVSSTSA